jgi:hypothetical protein
VHAMKVLGIVRIATAVLNLGTIRGEWLGPRPRPLTRKEKTLGTH